MNLSYIIPVANLGRSYPERIMNLRIAVDRFMNQQVGLKYEVIFVEQIVKPGLPTYQEKIQGDRIRFVTVNYPVFNKCWLINVGARAAQAPVFMVGEADIFTVDREYFKKALAAFSKEKAPWAFAWNQITYLTPEETERLQSEGRPEGSAGRCWAPKPGLKEGGVLIYDRKWYFKIGGHNEWIQALGGPDNEMAARARWWSKSYVALPFHIYHMHHDTVKGHWKTDKHRVRNREIIKNLWKHMGRLAPWLANVPVGSSDAPVCTKMKYPG